jgi:hypothetical protein
MKIMLNDNSALEREETPHTINIAVKQRAESVISDKSIDARSRALIRYALETSDPWLAELLRRAEAGESLLDTVDFSQIPSTDFTAEMPIEEKVKALADIICLYGDDPGTRSAALLVLVAAIESSPHPRALATVAKQLAFTRSGEMNVCGMVVSQIAVFECELFAGHTLAA